MYEQRSRFVLLAVGCLAALLSLPLWILFIALCVRAAYLLGWWR